MDKYVLQSSEWERYDYAKLTDVTYSLSQILLV